MERRRARVDLDPDEPVFVDETRAGTEMARRRGRRRRGERLRAGGPFDRRTRRATPQA